MRPDWIRTAPSSITRSGPAIRAPRSRMVVFCSAILPPIKTRPGPQTRKCPQRFRRGHSLLEQSAELEDELRSQLNGAWIAHDGNRAKQRRSNVGAAKGLEIRVIENVEGFS